ncbi:unnamed protein product [Lymnaea stagnalis]|uniref:Uncharacterized protein n=1 Tax=Lymnaea stagnalis TaxID=6523 RepID=A0AAV2HXA5_LYMST
MFIVVKLCAVIFIALTLKIKNKMADALVQMALVLILNAVLISCQETSALPGSNPQTVVLQSPSSYLPTDEVWQYDTRPVLATTPGDYGVVEPNTTQALSSPASPAESENTTSGIGSESVDSSKSGQADDLAAYLVQKMGEIFYGEDTPKEEVKDTHSLSNCSEPVGLSQFSSSVPDSVQAYFDDDVTFHGMCKKLFAPSVVEQLQSGCPRGGWCLGDGVRQNLMLTMESFYMEGPFCSNALWNCLNSMYKVRFDCEGKLILFMINAVRLLCDMEKAATKMTTQCYGRTLEALYVTYADLTHPNGTHTDQLNQQDCNDFRVQMTSTYLCADVNCEYDQTMILEMFEPRKNLPEAPLDTVESCNLTKTCPTGGDVLGEETTTFGESYDDYLNELKELEDEIEDAIKVADGDELTESVSVAPTVDNNERTGEGGSEQFDGDINTGSTGMFDEDRPMLYGLITMTIVLMVGLVGVAYIGFRRYRRTLFANYRRGYSQLTEEESKMLRQEYN